MDSDTEVTDYVTTQSHSLPSFSTNEFDSKIKNTNKAEFKQLSFSETVKLITDFSQELRKNIQNCTLDILMSLKPLDLKESILLFLLLWHDI